MSRHLREGRAVVLRSVSAGVLAQVAAISVAVSGAGPTRVADQVLTYEGVEYVCTGIAEAREDSRWERYPLKLVFAVADGGYLADVNVEVQDASGNVALRAACDGPWLLADLPAGTYNVTATAAGYTEKASIQVTRGQQVERTIHYPQGAAK